MNNFWLVVGDGMAEALKNHIGQFDPSREWP